MKMPRRDFPCGAIDALVPLIIAIALYAYEGVGPLRFFAEKGHILLFYMLPSCLIVGWRGSANAAKLISGDNGWFRPAAEGFAWGGFVIPVTHSFGFLSEALAAGSALPRVGDSLAVWLEYFSLAIRHSLALGGIGTCMGIGISSINRLVLRWTATPGRAANALVHED